MGSVKDLIVLKKPDNNNPGIGRFIFSDRYSVFDWGEMPNHIKDKGKALCVTGAYFFERLEEIGIKTHYLGVVENEKSKHLPQLNEPSNCMEFKLFRVITPQQKNDSYDYSIYRKERTNFLIPLEVIYRNSLPEGANLLKRLKDGKLKLKDIGFERIPLPEEKLKTPLLDVSTKLESTDRYITWKEAEKLTGSTKSEMEEIKRIILSINELITEEVKRIGLFNEDGKMEFGFDEFRDIVLVDVLGTPDECRFTFEGIPMCKEIARIFYRKTSWYKEVEEAKKRNKVNWKKTVDTPPPSLSYRLAELISMVYKDIANEITQRIWFRDTPPLKEIMYEIKDFIS